MDYPTLSSHKEEEMEAQSGGNGTKMVLPLNDTRNDENVMNMVHSLHNGLWTIRLLHRTKKRKRNPKEEETEAQGGENGTQMVLPLNDTLNGPK